MDWDDLYCHLSASLGWPWSQIDEMTLPQVYAFNKYFRKYPPAHYLIAAYMGVKPEPEPADFGQFLAEANILNGGQ